MTPLDYNAALDYLFAATDYEKMQRVRYNADTFSLDRMVRLLEALGRPDRRLRAVHVAGTKGKGSTAAMVHALAQQAGLKAGLYTSPHLIDIRERIRVGGETIAPAALAALVEEVRPVVERLRADGDAATFFEIFTALAFLHFAREGVDLAVVEVGLGGRLDATNVLAPDVAVIAAISLDHTLQLGDTLAAIAGEKAGIVKPGVPVVSHPQPAEALTVIERTCRERNSPLVLVGRDVTVTWAPATEAGRMGARLSVRTPAATYDDLFLPLMGEHQAENAAAAIAAAERAGPLAARLTPEIVRAALANVRWPGRMEVVPGAPPILLDGAHNRASVERLIAAVARHFPGVRPVVVFGSAADKDVPGMLAALAATVDLSAIVFTKTQTARAADPAQLRAAYEGQSGAVARVAGTFADASAALVEARALAGSDGLVVVCGSLYLVGEVQRLVAEHRL